MEEHSVLQNSLYSDKIINKELLTRSDIMIANRKNYILLGVICASMLLMFSCQSAILKDKNIISESECLEGNNQQWYNETCWNYADDVNAAGIEDDELEEFLANYKEYLSKSYVMINEERHPLTDLYIEESIFNMIFILMFSINDDRYTLQIPIISRKLDLAGREDGVKVRMSYLHGSYFIGDEITDDDFISEGTSTFHITVLEDAEKYFRFEGMIRGVLDSGETVEVKFYDYVSGGGDVDLVVEGNRAILTGTLGTQAYLKLKELSNNPDITTLVLYNVPGSINDSINMYTGRLIRDSGWNTYVPKNSSIESGGVDLFAAGVERIVEKGGEIGIHSWCCYLGYDGGDLPQEHPAHKFQLAYFRYVLGDEFGPKFYFRTLESAPADDIYYMSELEMKQYNLATKIIN